MGEGSAYVDETKSQLKEGEGNRCTRINYTFIGVARLSNADLYVDNHGACMALSGWQCSKPANPEGHRGVRMDLSETSRTVAMGLRL